MNTVEIILKNIRSVTGHNIFDQDQNLSEAGVDSIDYAEIVIITEQELNVNVLGLDINWSKIKTARELAEVFDGAVGG